MLNWFYYLIKQNLGLRIVAILSNKSIHKDVNNLRH